MITQSQFNEWIKTREGVLRYEPARLAVIDCGFIPWNQNPHHFRFDDKTTAQFNLQFVLDHFTLQLVKTEYALFWPTTDGGSNVPQISFWQLSKTFKDKTGYIIERITNEKGETISLTFIKQTE